MTVDFCDNNILEFQRRDDHLVIWANPFPNLQPSAPGKYPISFVFDPGAMITTLTLSTAKKLKYDLLPIKRVEKLVGFVPGVYVDVHYKVIPGIAIGGLRLSKTTVCMNHNKSLETSLQTEMFSNLNSK